MIWSTLPFTSQLIMTITRNNTIFIWIQSANWICITIEKFYLFFSIILNGCILYSTSLNFYLHLERSFFFNLVNHTNNISKFLCFFFLICFSMILSSMIQSKPLVTVWNTVQLVNCLPRESETLVSSPRIGCFIPKAPSTTQGGACQ